MRLKDLEKIALEKDAGRLRDIAWGLADAAATMTGKGIAHGARLAWKPMRYFAERSAENPGRFAGKAIMAAATVPTVYGLTSIPNYFSKVEQPTIYRTRGEFGRAIENPLYASSKYGELKMKMTDLLVKEAGLGDIASKIINSGYKLLGGRDRAGYYLPALAGLGGLGYVTMPTLKQVGENLKSNLFPVDQRINADEELAMMQLKALGEVPISMAAGKLEGSLKDREDLPAIRQVMEDLKKNDPIIAEAARDPRLNLVMQQTVDTVRAFAPSVAKDTRAMQSVLTEAVTSPEGGLSFQTIKALADTQKAIKQSRK